MDSNKILSLLFRRTALVALLLLLQVALVVGSVLHFSEYFVYLYVFCLVLSLVAVLHIINKPGDPGFKIAWIVPILLAPVFGGLLYLLCGGNGLVRKERQRMEQMDRHMREVLDPDKRPSSRPPGPIMSPFSAPECAFLNIPPASFTPRALSPTTSLPPQVR